MGNLSLRRAPPYLPLDTFAGHGAETEADGSFKCSVLPGTYLLSASDRKSGKMSPEMTIEVGDKDIPGIELTLDSSYEIAGRIVVDGSASLDYTKLHLSFMGERVKISSDGSFQASAGKTAQYFLHRVPENWYIKDVTVGGQHLAGRQFELKPGTTDISFVLSPDGASVEATRARGTSIVDVAMVLLLPENGPIPDAESLLLLQSDQSGKMIAHGVPPGSYRVFGLDATNWLIATNAKQFMEKYEKSAPLIVVAAGEHKSIVVTPTKISPE